MMVVLHIIYLVSKGALYGVWERGIWGPRNRSSFSFPVPLWLPTWKHITFAGGHNGIGATCVGRVPQVSYTIHYAV